MMWLEGCSVDVNITSCTAVLEALISACLMKRASTPVKLLKQWLFLPQSNYVLPAQKFAFTCGTVRWERLVWVGDSIAFVSRLQPKSVGWPNSVLSLLYFCISVLSVMAILLCLEHCNNLFVVSGQCTRTLQTLSVDLCHCLHARPSQSVQKSLFWPPLVPVKYLPLPLVLQPQFSGTREPLCIRNACFPVLHLNALGSSWVTLTYSYFLIQCLSDLPHYCSAFPQSQTSACSSILMWNASGTKECDFIPLPFCQLKYWWPD